ncbi:Cytosol aminopeptidase [Planctomycetes bacterium Pan216]|uniref:Probable cytosol aminopeptidase n=1 Tax=Kolteria novifilia TaxID=2527975 RepID=A0A518AXI2_9BACT|nr:Cytosol aminopeptidase [Planctomycetes bacterium Pan216]
MKIDLCQQPLDGVTTDWLAIGIFEGDQAATLPAELEPKLAETIARRRELEDFSGKKNELLTLYGVEGIAAERVLLVGLGKPDSFDRMTFTNAVSTAVRHANKKPGTAMVGSLPTGTSLDAKQLAEAAITGALMASQGQAIYKSASNGTAIDSFSLAATKETHSAAQEGIASGTILGEAINAARDLIDRPPAEIYPETFCKRALELAEPVEGLEVEILEPEKLKELGMNCILGVGQESVRPPRLMILRYRGKKDDSAPLAYVGKGITFDSGGLSLKTADGMVDMKCDMGGAATVVAATIAVARLGLPVNLLCLTPLAENMPGGNSYRPGDILTAKNGKTIEIVNTDAEGRLVLSDALCHAVDLGAAHIVELSTLTGACMVALGNDVAGVMTNDDTWAEQVLAAAKRTGELAWPLPMYEEFDDLIKSDVADMKNSGGRWGGAITAAKLLANFVGDVPWTHIDIAGPSFAAKEAPHRDGGATGYFVRTLVDLAGQYAP